MTNLQITEKGIFIKLSKSYRPDISPDELYEATRGIWVVGEI